MAHTSSLIVSLTATGTLAIELPGLNGMRRKIPLTSQSLFSEILGEASSFLKTLETEEAKKQAQRLDTIQSRESSLQETLLRILQGQLAGETEFDEDGNPSEHQIKHWQRHAIWADPSCPFCI